MLHAGFSIVTSTGQAMVQVSGSYDSFGHGLGVAPNVMQLQKIEDSSD